MFFVRFIPLFLLQNIHATVSTQQTHPQNSVYTTHVDDSDVGLNVSQACISQRKSRYILFMWNVIKNSGLTILRKHSMIQCLLAQCLCDFTRKLFNSWGSDFRLAVSEGEGLGLREPRPASACHRNVLWWLPFTVRCPVIPSDIPETVLPWKVHRLLTGRLRGLATSFYGIRWKEGAGVSWSLLWWENSKLCWWLFGASQSTPQPRWTPETLVALWKQDDWLC